MTWLFKAPEPVFEVFMALPAPEWRDIERPMSTVQVKQAMDGSFVTHVKTMVGRHYNFNFNLSRMKALEFVHVYKDYAGSRWEIEKTDGTKLVGYMKINPLTLDIVSRGVSGDSFEVVLIQVEFESIV